MVISELNVIRRSFLWNKSSNEHRNKCLHLLSWDKICQEKCAGGLGVSNLEKKNTAFLAKWWWRFHTDRDKLWWSFVQDKYGHLLEKFIHGDLNTRNLSPAMKGILEVAHSTSLVSPSSFKWIVGNGNSIVSWSDFWWQNHKLAPLFPRLFLLAIDKEIKLSTMAHLLISSRESVNSIWRRPLRGWNISYI